MEAALHHVLPYIVNFSIVVVLLFVVGHKPFQKFVFQRHERLKDFVEDSRKVFGTAQSRNTAISSKVSSLDREEREILDAELISARKDAEEVVAKGDAEAERILKDATKMAAAEAAEIEARVKAQFLDQVLNSVEGRLKEDLNRDDHKKIVQRAQSSIGVGA
jgi:F0F1-type ATP synthase membrane subunit b/b'